jgi:hypothetical protein
MRLRHLFNTPCNSWHSALSRIEFYPLQCNHNASTSSLLYYVTLLHIIIVHNASTSSLLYYVTLLHIIIVHHPSTSSLLYYVTLLHIIIVNHPTTPYLSYMQPFRTMLYILIMGDLYKQILYQQYQILYNKTHNPLSLHPPSLQKIHSLHIFLLLHLPENDEYEILCLALYIQNCTETTYFYPL